MVISVSLAGIGEPNHAVIANMPGKDLLEAREYWIVQMINSKRKNNSDGIKKAISWIESLTSEMRLRGPL